MYFGNAFSCNLSLFEMHFKVYPATNLHLMVNLFQGICVDLKCFKGNAFFLSKGEIYLAIINCRKEMHFKPCNELEGLWGRCIFLLKQNSY